MTSYDVKRLALVFALQAEIEGMKSENVRWVHAGDVPTYSIVDFVEKAEELRILASKHDHEL
jgi:hypothetical protein